MSAPPAPRCARPACWPGSGRRLAGGGGRGSSWSGSAAVPEGLAAAVGCGPLCALCTCPPRVRLSPSAGRRAQGAGTHGLTREGLPEPGAGVCASHPGPLGSRLGARGLGRSSAQPISNCLDAVGGVLRWRGSQLPLPASVSGEELVPGTPEEDPGGSSPPRPHPCWRGVVWVGPASPAAAALCSSGVSSDRLLHSPPGRLSCPSPVLPAHLHAGFSTQGVGGGEAVGARMLKGCRAPGPELLS